MPKSRHRKNQKQRSKVRTNKIKAEIKRYQEKQKEEYMKLLKDAQAQQVANQQKEENQIGDLNMASTNINIDTSKGGDVSGISYK